MTTHNLPTIAAALRATRSLSTCERLLALAGLEEMLQGEKRCTFFAPTDTAFSELPPGTLSELETDATRLRATLEYHILGVGHELHEIRNGKLRTLEGTLLTSMITDDGLRLDHANVSRHPIRCANGVIHPIDAVLFPGSTPKVSAMAQRESAWSGRPRSSRPSPDDASAPSPTSA